MMIDKSTVGDVTIVAPKGSIDIDTSRILKEELHGLIDTGRTAILVDFSGVDFMTSTGLGVLVAVAKRVEEVDGNLALCSLSDDIQSIFDTVGFTPFFDIHRSAKEALASLS
jgi:anti-anti-sigma factor